VVSGASGGHRRRFRTGALPVVALVAVLTSLLTGSAGWARDDNVPPAHLVAAATAAYGDTGALGVAVARQHTPVAGLSIRAAEAHSARIAAHTADNGPPAERPFPTASMVKLFLAEDILHQARTGHIALTEADVIRLQEMIRHSDDSAASALWVRFGGARAVADVARRYGLTGTAPPAVPGQWGEATTTARDLARFLARLPVTAHPTDAATLLEWMRTATPLAADGFDQRFGLFGTVPDMPAVKQGWMCCVGGNRHLHSVGVVGHRVVVLLSEVPRTVGYDRARAALTAAAAALPPPQRP
jgi:hypothetical protein